jgi:hypothetical protein
MKNITCNFINHLGRCGLKGTVIPIHCIKDLQLQMNEMLPGKCINKNLVLIRLTIFLFSFELNTENIIV